MLSQRYLQAKFYPPNEYYQLPRPQMTSLRPLVLFSLASLTASASIETNLRSANRNLQVSCPETVPTSGGDCISTDPQRVCRYNGIKIPTYKDNGSCSGPLACTAINECFCDASGWICSAMSIAPCQGSTPGQAFTSCDL